MAIIGKGAAGRAYSVGKYGLEIGGKMAGWIKECEGGNVTADVIEEKIGATHIKHKHLGNIKYEEISLKCGTGMTKDLFHWIETGFTQTSYQSNAGRRDGALINANYDNEEVTRLSFTKGLLTEFGLPALDAASKDAALMSVKFQPEKTIRSTGGGGKLKQDTNPVMQKMWTPAFFKLTFDDKSLDCSKVNKIDAITIKQKTVAHQVGQDRDYEVEPTSVEYPNLVITMSESHGDGFYNWYNDFVIAGNCSDGKEKSAQLDYMAADKNTILFTMHFMHLGVFKISPDKVEAGGDGLRRIKIEMYCEEMKFDFDKSKQMYA